jgi:hypothetical protein
VGDALPVGIVVFELAVRTGDGGALAALAAVTFPLAIPPSWPGYEVRASI